MPPGQQQSRGTLRKANPFDAGASRLPASGKRPGSGALINFYREGRRSGTFEDGIELALRRLLMSPQFLVRAEREPANLAMGKSYRITELELASRLSFFLWSSIPDDQLINLAAQGRLSNPTVLEQQVKRMLADPRSDALVTNFADQLFYCGICRRLRPTACTIRIGMMNCGRDSGAKPNCSLKA